jgi:hypothetical protein
MLPIASQSLFGGSEELAVSPSFDFCHQCGRRFQFEILLVPRSTGLLATTRLSAPRTRAVAPMVRTAPWLSRLPAYDRIGRFICREVSFRLGSDCQQALDKTQSVPAVRPYHCSSSYHCFTSGKPVLLGSGSSEYSKYSSVTYIIF